jgi:hypothetical protein
MIVKSLKEHADEMRKVGLVLPGENDDDLLALRMREVRVDGHDLVVHYVTSNFDDMALETLNVFGKYIPFVPLTVVCKVVREFLGTQKLALLQIFKDGRRVYQWNVLKNIDGDVVPYPDDGDVGNCDGLLFSLIK